MAPFNANEPQDGEINDADFVRAQLNALNDLITALTLRVAALENPPATHTATGFGDPRANGAVTQIDTFGGYPLYQMAGGAFLSCDGPSWRITFSDPRTMTENAAYSRGDVSPWGAYGVYMGTPPAGTVS